MKVKLNTEFVRKLPLEDVDVWDAKYPGLVLRCRTSGVHTYRVSYGRGKWVTLGRADTLTPEEARGKARDELSAISKGRDPKADRKSNTTFKQFLADRYEPWALEHHKRGAETLQRLRTVFAAFLSFKLTEITPWAFEKWRTDRLKGVGAKRKPQPETVNSHLTMLKAVLAKAHQWKVVPAHPLKDVKRVKADRSGRVRYLVPDEEKRLRAALEARDKARLARRRRSNAWRRERGYNEWPEDNQSNLTPIVKVALNTGLRKGEIFGLLWTDVDLARGQLTVRGAGAKSGQTRYVPLNQEAVAVISAWRRLSAESEHVFPGREAGEPLDDVKKAWLPVVKAAKLANFTFHDLRHTFASKLVMAGVDLNTVRELLGHADLKMTLRYAHLAPEHKAAAVAKLVAGSLR